MNNSHSKDSAQLATIDTETAGVFKIAHTPSHGFGPLVLKVTCPLVLFAAWYSCTLMFSLMTGVKVSQFSQLGLLLSLTFVGCFLLLLSSIYFRKEFVLRQSGITLPMLLGGGFRPVNWSWSQLTKVVFARSLPESPADKVVLYFQPGDGNEDVDVQIRLNEITQLDLKKLVYAIVSNAPHAVIQPPLEKVALEFPTVSGIKHLNFTNFTELWDAEFSTRYSPTLFVPLAPDDLLRNGAIKITELVACGGSAAIYSAIASDGSKIIVKEAVIPKNASEQLKTKAIELFNREALFLSKLDHPHIAKVLDHFVENEHHYEVLEFIDGLDLRRFVKERGPQPEDFVLNWMQQICEILVYLHSQEPPIIHRDLTPDNLVLRVDGQLVLIDFGAANAFVGTATGTMIGKQSYMAPEQLRGKAVPQSDIYSLGCTCYFLLTGRDPTPLEVSRVDNKEARLNELLARCTASEVADRYRTAHEMLSEVNRIRKQRMIESEMLYGASVNFD